MEKLEKEIAQIIAKIDEVELLLEKDYKEWTQKEKLKFGNHEILRKEKELLRKEKEQLRDKEKLLMKREERETEERLLLLKQGIFFKNNCRN